MTHRCHTKLGTILRFIAALAIAAALWPGLAASQIRVQTGPRAAGGDTVRYAVAFPNAAHHEAEVTVTYTNVPAGTLELRMSRSSPGRYALHEFAKNVYAVRAVDGRGQPLRVSRPNPHQWNVSGHDGTVRVTYTLFADRADGTYSGIDLTHAHLNIPATFMWARGLGERPIAVAFEPPPGAPWRAATQLVPLAPPLRFAAPNLYYFMDSPTELSDHDVREWQVASDGESYTIRLAVHHQGTAEQLDGYAAMVQDVVAEQIAVYGEPPDFDHGSYTFIADYLPWVAGDGMEHRNSTILTSTGSLRNPHGVLGTASHEFFHAWNVERIRPATLEPFDFEAANMSRELWLAEGFTSYYGPLTIRRAGHMDDAAYAATIGRGIDAIVNSAGRRYFGPVEMSMQAPFVDAAAAIDPNNRANTFISYYTWGAAIGLGLDLTLRTRFDLTLDDFMRAMWRRFGEPERPYTVEDARAVLAEVTRDEAFARDFFDRYILGREVVDYAALLANAAFLVRQANAGRATFGEAPLQEQGNVVHLVGSTIVGTPLYEAGIDRGDRIVSVDDAPVTRAAQLAEIAATHRPGDSVRIAFEQRGATRTATVQLIEDPELEVVTFEQAGRAVPAAAAAFRREWLGSKAGR